MSSNWIEIFTTNTQGPGSGLDADLLDGKQGNTYWNKSDISTFGGQIPSKIIDMGVAPDLNTFVNPGIYAYTSNSIQNAPEDSLAVLYVTKPHPNYIMQTFTTRLGNVYIRTREGTTNWRTWTRHWTNADIPTFSGQLPNKPVRINDGVDYNSVINPGIYRINSVNPSTPRPLTGDSFLFVGMMTSSVDYIFQYNIHYDGRTFIRTKAAGVWSNWIALEDKNSTQFQLPNVPNKKATDVDLDTLTTPGYYTLIGGNTNLNYPVDLTGKGCSLLVLDRYLGDEHRTQLLMTAPHRFFVRTKTISGGSPEWSAWAEMANTSDTYSKTEADTKYATKADTYTRSQLYTKSEIASIVPGAILSSCWLRGSKEVSYTGSNSVTLPLQGIPTEVIGTASTWEHKPEEGYLIVDSAGQYKIETYKSVLYFKSKNSEEWWKQFDFFLARDFTQGSEFQIESCKMQAFIDSQYPESFGDNTQRYSYKNNNFLITHASKITLPDHPDYNKWIIRIPSYYIRRSNSAPSLPATPITIGVNNEIFISKLS